MDARRQPRPAPRPLRPYCRGSPDSTATRCPRSRQAFGRYPSRESVRSCGAAPITAVSSAINACTGSQSPAGFGHRHPRPSRPPALTWAWTRTSERTRSSRSTTSAVSSASARSARQRRIISASCAGAPGSARLAGGRWRTADTCPAGWSGPARRRRADRASATEADRERARLRTHLRQVRPDRRAGRGPSRAARIRPTQRRP